MVFQENILKRVRAKERKAGIYYPEKDGMLYNRFKGIYFLTSIFANVWNVLFVTGIAVLMEEDQFICETLDFVTVAICTVLMIGALIASKFNDNLIVASAFGVVNIITSAVLSYSYAMMQSRAKGILLNYYWRHLGPLSISALCALAMTLIVLTAYFRLKKHYNEVLEEVYADYNSLEGDDKPEWEEYLKNYRFNKNKK